MGFCKWYRDTRCVGLYKVHHSGKSWALAILGMPPTHSGGLFKFYIAHVRGKGGEGEGGKTSIFRHGFYIAH